MISNLIRLALSNFGLCMLALAIVFSIVQLIVNKKLGFFEIVYRWFSYFPLGLTAIYAFIMHVFYPDFTAATIGWPNSPFQYEVAMADLGFGVIALLSFRASYGFRLATVIANTCWLWGDTVGHSYQMIVYRNFSLGNAGSWFYMDVFLPVILLICIVGLKRREGK